MRLHLDYETASELNIKKTGAYRYAAHPSTRILMLGWAIDDGPVNLWEPHLTQGHPPDELIDALMDPAINKHAYNAAFERLITRHCLGIDIPYEQWRCTMVESYYLGFAGSLNMVLKAVGLEPKDDRGGRLINVFSTPAPKNHKADWYDWDNKPAEWEEFCQYCRQDVHVERQLWHWMQQFPKMADWDQKQWCLDQSINDRGVPMDKDLAYAAIEIWDREKANLTQELQDMTGLPKVTRGPFLDWIEEHTGVKLENTRKDYLAAMLKSGELPDAAKPFIDLWAQKEGKATSKYQAVLNGAGEEDRARGMFQYKGASRTDRVGGRLIQLQNLKRPFVKPDEIDTLVETIKCVDPKFLDMMYKPSVSAILGGAIRHVIHAKPDHTFVVSDLTSIESVVLGWVAQCPAIDATFRGGKDSYREFASRYYGIPYDEVTPDQRSFSKPPVLGCFAADTLVLTDQGYVPILYVSASHRVFDGVEWVSHGGVIDQGVKEVVDGHGVTATPDHKFLVGETWTNFEDLTDAKATQAVSTATGLSSNTLTMDSIFADVLVEPKVKFTEAILGMEGRDHVSHVPIEDSRGIDPLPQNSEFPKETTTASLIDFMRRRRDALCLPTLTTPTTGDVGSKWSSIAQKTMSDILLPLMAGMYRDLKSTGVTTMQVTRKGTSDSSIDEEIQTIPVSTEQFHTKGSSTLQLSSGENSHQDTATKAPSPVKLETDSAPHRSSMTKKTAKAHTYDIANAGPRNRFTILTDKGPMIVHNCGFMLGWKGLMAYAEGYGVDMDKDQAKLAVETFRDMYPEIPEFWSWIYNAVKSVTMTGVSVKGYRLTIERDESFLRIWLPSGRAISYYQPEIRKRAAPWAEKKMTDKAQGATYENFKELGWDDKQMIELGYMRIDQYVDNFCYMGMSDKNQWVRIYAHAGGVTENIVQSIAGDFLWHGLTTADEAGLPVVLHVHDEIAAEVQITAAPWALLELQRCMTTLPSWAQDMWIGAAGFITDRYTKD